MADLRNDNAPKKTPDADPLGFGLTSKEPLGPNPFPKEDVRHAGWVAACRIARKDLMLYNSALLSRKPPSDAPFDEIQAWWIEMLAGRFAIMGAAAMGVFGTTDESISACEKLLDHFAAFTLLQAEKVGRRLSMPSLVSKVRWKVTEYREHIVGKALECSSPTEYETILRDLARAQTEGALPAKPLSITAVPARAKPGPRQNREVAQRVREIVTKIAGADPWKDKLEDICEALDEERIACPATWRKREPPVRDWLDAAVTARGMAKQAIDYRLKIART